MIAGISHRLVRYFNWIYEVCFYLRSLLSNCKEFKSEKNLTTAKILQLKRDVWVDGMA
jgi:hypothetical protein